MIFHYEASNNIKKDLEYIKSKGIKCGLAIKPETNYKVLLPYLKILDYILIMSVSPGFGGQGFIEESLIKMKNTISACKDAERRKNIVIGVDCSPGLMKNCYIQGSGGVAVGDYTQIASNVSIVSDNHNPYDCREHSYSSVKIGKYCWIGVGATILAGVELGDFTIVAAGAVVTKSFTDGHCIIAGVPAKKIKDLEVNNCVRYEASTKYYGYLDERKFKRRFA